MQILIVKLSAIGDVVQTLPALEAIKSLYPESAVTWVVEEAAAGILEGNPLIDRLLVSRRKAWLEMLKKPGRFGQGREGILEFTRQLKSIRYDIAIDFQGLLKSGMVMGLARAKRKIGFDRTRELSYLFLNERLPAYDREKHAVERYLDVARYLGAVNPGATCRLFKEKETVRVRQRIDGLARNGRRLIVINPIARWETKLWPEQNFAELADRLISERNAAVVFTGSPADRTIIDRITGMMHGKQAANWAGDTSLKELAALAAEADLFITTDTGPMHLAAAAGGKVIALFGPTAPWRTGPYGSGHVVLRTGVECSPCFDRKCRRKSECMREISVADVLKQVRFEE